MYLRKEGNILYSRELLKLMLKNGWQIVSQKGSHMKLKKGNQIEILPIHNKELKIGTLKAILKRTGLE